MISALDKGMEMAEQFVHERLVVQDGDSKPTKSLYHFWQQEKSIIVEN